MEKYFYINVRNYIHNYIRHQKVNISKITDEVIQAAYDDLSTNRKKEIVELKFNDTVVPSNTLIANSLGVSYNSISQKICMFAFKVIKYSEKDNLSDIRELNELSLRTKNSLNRAGIFTIEDLRNTSEEKLLKTRNIGSKSIDEIKELCKKHGFTL